MLKQSVSDLVASMQQMSELMDAEQLEIDALSDAVANTRAQFYIKTATTDIGRWEIELGIPTDPSMSIEKRVANVVAKINTVSPASKNNLSILANKMTGLGNEIVEYPNEYRFEIYMDNLDHRAVLFNDVMTAIEEAKPAHVAASVYLRLTFAIAVSATTAKYIHTHDVAGVVPGITTLGLTENLSIAADDSTLKYSVVFDICGINTY